MINHEYKATGTYTATITATNTISSDSASTLVEIIPATISIIGLIAENDSPTTLGNATQLSATVTSGSDVQHRWEFDDGESGEGALVAHVYPATGIYTVTVSAENAVSQAFAVTEVEIVIPPGHLYLPLVTKR